MKYGVIAADFFLILTRYCCEKMMPRQLTRPGLGRADRIDQHRMLDARNGPMGQAGLAAELRRRGFTVTPLVSADLAAY